jgi:tol-pal system protein YbgF
MRVLFLSLLSSLFLFGCATRKEIVGFQEDTRKIRADLDSVKTDQEWMKRTLESVENSLRELRANSEYGSSALEERVETLATRLDEILTRFDRTFASVEEMRQSGTGDATGPTAVGVDVYDAAMQDLSLGNYDLAEVGFLSFLGQNPKSELADDARYGLAESFYARKQYDDASAEYSRVLDMDPMGWKAPASMLKLGLCYKAMSRPQEARTVWQQLVRDFPNSDEAKVAQQRLAEMGR